MVKLSELPNGQSIKAISGSISATLGNLTVNTITAIGTVDGRDISVDGAKLDGIESGSTSNSTDAFLLSRSNHTGTQAIATITNLQTSLDNKANDSEVLKIANDLSDVNNASLSRSNLGLEIGVNVQAYSAVLDATTASFTTALETKLNGIQSGAEVNRSLEELQDINGAMFTSNSEVGITSTYNDTSGKIDLSVGGLTTSEFASTNISQWTNDVGYITETLSDEQVQDVVGNMVTGNTETLITVTYQDVDGTLDFVVDNNLANYDNTTSGFLDGADIGVNVQAFSTVLQSTTASFTMADETKLDGIESGSTSNSTDAFLLSRSNHTGTQAIATITNLQTSLDAKLANTDIGATVQAYSASTVLSNQSNTYGDGLRQTFNPNGTNAGINVGSHTADPSSPVDGDIYLNSTSNQLLGRINGAWVNLGAGSGGGDSWSDPVDADIVPDGDGTRDLGNTATRFAETYTDTITVTDSVTIGSHQIKNIGKTTLSSAQILALNSTPVTIATAPGANKLIKINGAILKYNYNTTAYAGVGLGDNLAIRYVGGDDMIVQETQGMIDQTNDEVRTPPLFSQAVSDLVALENTSIEIYLKGAITTGDGTVDIWLDYDIIDLT